MRFGRRFGKRSKREEIAGINAVLRFYAAASDKPGAMQKAEELQRDLPKQRGPRVDHPDLEKHVLSAVGDLLAAHPRVLLAVRQNSGGAYYSGSDGKQHAVWFYKMMRPAQPLTLTDYWGFLTDARPFAFECKRPSWRKPSSDREFLQEKFLELIRSCGGVAQFVVSADQVQEALAK